MIHNLIPFLRHQYRDKVLLYFIEEVKKEVQEDVDALKSALNGDDIEKVKSAQEKLMTSSQKLGEAIYSAKSDEPQAESTSSNEDVVDAEVVDEDDEEKK